MGEQITLIVSSQLEQFDPGDYANWGDLPDEHRDDYRRVRGGFVLATATANKLNAQRPAHEKNRDMWAEVEAQRRLITELANLLDEPDAQSSEDLEGLTSLTASYLPLSEFLDNNYHLPLTQELQKVYDKKVEAWNEWVSDKIDPEMSETDMQQWTAQANEVEHDWGLGANRELKRMVRSVKILGQLKKIGNEHISPNEVVHAEDRSIRYRAEAGRLLEPIAVNNSFLPLEEAHLYRFYRDWYSHGVTLNTMLNEKLFETGLDYELEERHVSLEEYRQLQDTHSEMIRRPETTIGELTDFFWHIKRYLACVRMIKARSQQEWVIKVLSEQKTEHAQAKYPTFDEFVANEERS